MQWDEYYNKIDEWSTNTAVSRASQLENFGPAEEVYDAFLTLAFDDEKGATRLIKKALKAGVQFKGEHFVDLELYCPPAVVEEALKQSSDSFSSKDLEELCGNIDDDVVVAIAKKNKLKIPSEIKEWYEDDAEDDCFEEDYKPDKTEIKECIYSACDNLYCAYEHLKKAYGLSIADVSRKKSAIAVAKHAFIIDAQSYIESALAEIDIINEYYKTIKIQPISFMNVSKRTLWSDVLDVGIITDFAMRRNVRKLLYEVKETIGQLEKLKIN